MRRHALFAATLLIASLPSGAARAEDDPHAGCVAPPSYVPAALLERPLPLRRGVGNSRETVTTGSQEAQAYYDQGLNYVESYVWIEAARSFHQALRLDPKLALAYVGLSRVQSGLGNDKAARLMLERAKALGLAPPTASGAASRSARSSWTRSTASRTRRRSPRTRRRSTTRSWPTWAIRSLWLMRGTAEESNASGRGQRGNASSVAFYERALQLVPDHASAHHYLVHSYETIGRIEDALVHGEAYARLSPAIPHAAHMWAHDLRRVGRMDEAIVQFLKVDSLERAYFKAERLDPSLDWHHGHNLDLLATCYEHKGQMATAEKILRRAATLEPRDAYRAFNTRELPNFLIHRAATPRRCARRAP